MAIVVSSQYCFKYCTIIVGQYDIYYSGVVVLYNSLFHSNLAMSISMKCLDWYYCYGTVTHNRLIKSVWGGSSQGLSSPGLSS